MKSFLTLLVFLCPLIAYSSKSASLDSLMHLYYQEKVQDTASVSLRNNISLEYVNVIHFDSTDFQSNRDSALYWNNQAILLSRKLNYKKGEAQSQYHLGKMSISLNEYALSSNALQKARELFIQLNDKSGIADCYLQTGVLMYVQKNFQEALANFRMATPTYRETNNIKRLSQNQYLTGLCLYELGDYKHALPDLLSALSLQMNQGSEWECMQTRMALAHVYYKTGKYADALIFYRYGLDFFTGQPNASEALLICNTGIGNVLAAQNDDREAEKYFLAAFEISKKIRLTWRSLQVTEPLYQFYEKRGDYKRANYFQKLYRDAKDSLFNEKNTRIMANLLAQSDIAKKQAELDKEKQKDDFNKKLNLNLIIILGLLIALLAGLYRRFRFRKKLYSVLELKNKELTETLQHLNATEQQLIKAEKMAVFGKLTAGIAHEIRNPLNFITNFSEMSEQIADDFAHAEDEVDKQEMALQLKKLVDKIGYHGRRADSIVTRMLQHSRKAHTDLELIDINSLCNEFSDLAYQSMRNMITNFECRMEKNLDPAIPRIWSVPQDISRLIINLLNNAFYAVHDKKHLLLNGYVPEVSIATFRAENWVCIRITDNGSGIPEDVKGKIFEPFFTTKPIGEGTGLGLSICVDIVKAARGEITVESSPGNGTGFEVKLPITEI